MGLYAENAWFSARTVDGTYTVISEEYDEHGPLFRAIVERGTAGDAILAAAAPEMAEMLEYAVENCTDCGPDEHGTYQGTTDNKRWCRKCQLFLGALRRAGKQIQEVT